MKFFRNPWNVLFMVWWSVAMLVEIAGYSGWPWYYKHGGIAVIIIPFIFYFFIRLTLWTYIHISRFFAQRIKR